MKRLQRKAHDAVRGLYEHSAQDERELKRLSGQTQLLLHDGATLTDAAPRTHPAFSDATTSTSDPAYHASMMPWEIQGNPSASTTSTNLGDSTMTDLLHPTVASDMRIFNTDIFTSTSTDANTSSGTSWGSFDSVYDANSNQSSNEAFAAATGTTVEHALMQDPLTSTHDAHRSDNDPLAFLLGPTDNMFGLDVGTEPASLDQSKLNWQVPPQNVADQQTMAAHADANSGVLGQQQQDSRQLGEGNLERAQFERVWHEFMEQLGLSNPGI
jgi:hypothetical protein